MYQIFEIGGNARKSRVFASQSFNNLDEAECFLDNAVGVVQFEIDPDHDAADVFTARGQVFAVERVDLA